MTEKHEDIVEALGVDDWRTWSGRTHGTGEFEYLDLFRGVSRSLKKRFVWAAPPAGSACPICFETPVLEIDWHITSGCGHSVCKDCFRGFAASQVRDPDHDGPLKCPMCPRNLRPSDAMKAIGHDSHLIARMDLKMRDRLLRKMRGFRHCPNCNHQYKQDEGNESESEQSSIVAGGGFVTQECLNAANEERERLALSWLENPLMSHRVYVVLYMVGVYKFYSDNSAGYVALDILNATLTSFWILRKMWLLGKILVSFEARQSLGKPITVECPCCQKSFLLNAESELGHIVVADEKSEKWIRSNTRPCPWCSVPISKTEGCNHMRCSHCRSKFCWACMKVDSVCQAYGCKHGAPYGNATRQSTPIDNNNSARESRVDGNTNILSRIRRMEIKGNPFGFEDLGALAFVFIGVYASERPASPLVTHVLSPMAHGLVEFLVTVVIIAIILGIILFFFVRYIVKNFLLWWQDTFGHPRHIRWAWTNRILQRHEESDDEVMDDRRSFREAILRSYVER